MMLASSMQKSPCYTVYFGSVGDTWDKNEMKQTCRRKHLFSSGIANVKHQDHNSTHSLIATIDTTKWTKGSYVDSQVVRIFSKSHSFTPSFPGIVVGTQSPKSGCQSLEGNNEVNKNITEISCENIC